MRATILMPTHGDRSSLLPYSVGSALRQSVEDIELFIMGDGVSDEARAVIRDLQSKDARIRFFDHPKDSRRGEWRRHEALKEAKGRIVAYLCDRDLMLPDHVETLDRLLEKGNFAQTLTTQCLPDGSVMAYDKLNIGRPSDVAIYLRPDTVSGIGLSFMGHTLEFYRRLPEGWATTPNGIPTDAHMWKKFLSHPECRPVSIDHATILYFATWYSPYEKKRDVAQWERELKAWSKRLEDPEWIRTFRGNIHSMESSLSARSLKRLKRWLQSRKRLYAAAMRIPFLHRAFVSAQARLNSRKDP